MPVQVTFSPRVRRGPILDEAEIDRQFEAGAEALRAGRDYGQIVIRCEGRPEARIDDELWAIVLNLCFRAVPDLVAGRAAIVPYFRSAGEIRIVPAGDRAKLSGDDVPDADYPLGDLVAELVACGRRYVAFRRRLWGDDPDNEAAIAELDAAADEADRALRGAHG